MKLYVISDTHFGHAAMVNRYYRKAGYEAKIQKYLYQIPEDATLIHLGDICIGKDAFWHDQIIRDLKCKKILVRGNHDNKSYTWYLNHGWDMVCERLDLKYLGKNVSFTHMPDVRKKEGINIHGHYHNRFNKKMLRGVGCRCYSCEVENNKPRTVESIINEFNQIDIDSKN